MSEKLGAGASFPNVRLTAVDGSEINLPDDIQTDHAAILFYRGHW